MSPQHGELIMDTTSGETPSKLRQEPWNKARSSARRHRSSWRTSGRCEYGCRWQTGSGSAGAVTT